VVARARRLEAALSYAAITARLESRALIRIPPPRNSVPPPAKCLAQNDKINFQLLTTFLNHLHQLSITYRNFLTGFDLSPPCSSAEFDSVLETRTLSARLQTFGSGILHEIEKRNSIRPSAPTFRFSITYTKTQ
jgi:hypothetical protein